MIGIECSFTRLTANAFCLPNCLYCSLASSALDIIINTDTLLLVNHLLDGYLYAWNHPVQEKDDGSDQLLCSGHRITFFNNSVYDLFVSQLFTDEAVLLPHNSSTPYSYKLATAINQDAPILRFSFLATIHLFLVLGRRASIFIPSVRIRKSPSNSIWSVVEKVNRSHATRYHCVHLCVVDCLHLCSKYVSAGNSYHFLPHPTAFHVSYASGSSDA